MYNSYENGGYKVPNIKYFCMAQKIIWIKKLLNYQYIAEWKNKEVITYGLVKIRRHYA
jgi:hypothetical protein